MKTMRNTMMLFGMILLSASLIHGQDLSKYRSYSLGTSLDGISKQVNETPANAQVIQQSPASIQELAWWPVKSYQSPVPSEPVQEIIFSFYNGALYKIGVTYENSATEGLTAEDMVRAISATYGAATLPVAAKSAPVIVSYSGTEVPIAFWENSQYSLTLSRYPLSQTFRLVMFSKQVNSQAEGAIAAAMKRDSEDAPQKEIARVKKVADDLEIARQNNLKVFQP